MSLSDTELFLSSMKDVKPLSNNIIKPTIATHGIHSSQHKTVKLTQVINDTFSYTDPVTLLEPHTLLSFKQSGVQPFVFKNLRLAKYQLNATLNLQGLHLPSAHKALVGFINECHQQNLRVVLIQHGIGIKNKSKPGILKSYVNEWLKNFHCVLAFHTALTHHGGKGATYVMLKNSDDKKVHNKEINSSRN